MKTARYTCLDETLVYDPQYVGENNATQLTIDFADCDVDGFAKFLEVKVDDVLLPTYDLGVGDEVTTLVPSSWLAHSRLEIQPLATDGEIERRFAVRQMYVQPSLVYDTTNLIDYYKTNNMIELTSEPTGFVNNQDIVVSYDKVTRKVTLTGITSAYYKGALVQSLVSGWVSPAHADVQGTYYLYYHDGEFVFSTTPWAFDDLMIAFIQYNSHQMAIREVHGFMPHVVHQELHETIGTYRVTGGDFSSYVAGSAVAGNRRPDISATVVADEDLRSTIPALTTKLYTQRFLSGLAVRSFNVAQPEIIAVNGNQPYYNQNVGGNWQQTLFPNNDYGAVFVVALPMTADAGSQAYRYMFVQPQQTSSDINVIRSLVPSNLTHGDSGSLVSEFSFIAKIIIRYIGGNWQIVEISRLDGTRISQVAYSAGNALTVVTTDATLTGNGTPASPLSVVSADLNYVHNQIASSDTWTITHGLNKYPSVSIVDTGGNVVVGEVKYDSLTQVTVTFSSAFSGKAYLN